MLKKLRKKFILITMASVVFILTAIMVVVNLVNYAAVVRSADEVVTFLLSNDGRFPLENRPDQSQDGFPPAQKPDQQNGERERGPGVDQYSLPENMNKETPFDTRFFSVTFTGDKVTAVDTDNVAAVSEEEAQTMAQKALASRTNSGTIKVYRYGKKVNDDGSTTVLFMDISRRLEPIDGFIQIGLIVIAVCIVLLFVAIVFLSKPLLKPIAESYQRQKRFITDAGHELKTPLTIISANNEIQEMETGETDCTKIISKQVSRMTTMVKNLTELARMDEEEKLSMERFSLSDALSDVVAPFANVYQRSGKKLDVSCQNEINYQGTEAMIRRLFTLLLENASKYSLTFTKVELTKKGRHIYFTVTNDANGITAGDQEKCFERFYRSDEARGSQTEGSGIGLSTAREIVRLHKGKITAQGTADGLFIIRVIL